MSLILQDFCLQCHNILVNESTEEVIGARQYLYERKLNNKTFAVHNIGYCPENLEIPKDVATYGSRKDSDYEIDYSRYIRGKIIVPIYEEFGGVIGFATRKPTFEEGNTWWNIPFSKGSNLFLLHKSKKFVFEQNKIYVVEGYIDALTLYQNGLTNVVCVMGTALTLRHIALISRYCNNVCLCFDVDENNSGQKATCISVALLRKYDFCETLSIIQDLPVGEDPSSYVVQFGLDSFLSKERDLTDKQIKVMLKELAAKKADKERMYAR